MPDLERLVSGEYLRLSRSEIPFAAKVVTIFYSVLAVFHFFLLEGVLRVTMVSLALVTSASGLLVWRFCLRGKELTSRQVLVIQAFFSLAVLLNGFVHLAVSEEIRQTVNILLIYIFMVYLRPPLLLFYALLTGSGLLWLYIVVIYHAGSPELVHYTFGMFMTSAVASLIYTNNRRLTREGIYGFRQRLVLEQRLKEANRQLNELAMLDPLTGISNRRSFDAFFERLCQRAAKNAEPVTFALCDVDYLKRFNDRWGHQSGDVALSAVAKLLSEHVRGINDTVCRLGGDEFALLLGNSDSADAKRVAERLYEKLPVEVGDKKAISATMGFYSFLPSGETRLDKVLEMADQALYEAKAAGRGCYRCWSSATQQ